MAKRSTATIGELIATFELVLSGIDNPTKKQVKDQQRSSKSEAA